MRKDRNLLEDLMKQLNCVYLSDLRTADFQNQAVCAALKFLPEDYPAAQWRDAANYLLDRAECLNTTEEARQLLPAKTAASFNGMNGTGPLLRAGYFAKSVSAKK